MSAVEIKERLTLSFSKGANFYESEAKLQKICALKFREQLELLKNRLVPGKALEIGCGTGFLTREVLSHFPHFTYKITDLCLEMVEHCRKNVNQTPLTFEVLDGEQFQKNDEYALIFSSLVFQWFHNFERSVQNLYRGLKKGGLLCFSVLEEGSFVEWKRMCEELSLPFSGNLMPSFEQLDTLRKQISTDSILVEEELKLTYPSAHHFFRNLKKIGTGISLKGIQLSLSEMRSLLTHWDNKCGQDVSVTYRLATLFLFR